MRNPAPGIFLLLSLTSALQGQVTAPAAVAAGPSVRLFLPDGTFHYALTVSNTYENGDAIPGGSLNLTNLSGDLSYSSPSPDRPFHLLYTGGWLGSSSPAQPSTSFHTLALTQAFNFDKWLATISNQFSYLPESPTSGLSGIPGLGDIGLQGAQPPAARPAGLLTNFATLIDDTATGDASRQISFDTNLTGGAIWSKRVFLEGSGLDTVEVGGTLGVDRRLSGRSNIGANYAFSRFSYSALGFSFVTNGVNVVGHRQWTRGFRTSGSIGPEWTSSSNARAVPSHLALAVNASANYTRRLRSATIAYNRGSAGGSGVLPGAYVDSVQGSIVQSFRRSWGVALTGSYTKLSGNGSLGGLGGFGGVGGTGTNTGAGTSRFIGLQCTRALGRTFSTYASYTAQFQSFDQSLAVRNALSGVSQIIGAGITFSPQSKHLGQL